MISEPMACSTQTVHRSCTKISNISKQTKVSLEPHHLGVPLVASKLISEQLARLAQTVHLSCINSNTNSKEKVVRFHMTHITYEFHRVRPK
jgi:alanine-alpha-ketoisovalerate/valine-pyruvate aminotransferase